MGGDGGGTALAFAGDGERIEFVDTGGEVEIARGGGGVGDGDGRADGIETEVGDDDLVGAGGKRGQDVAAGVVRQCRETEGGHGDLGSFKEIAGAEVGDVAAEGRGVRGGCEGEREENAGNNTQTGPF